MKVALLIEDRDTGYLFLDKDNAPEDAEEVELKLSHVSWSEIGDRDLASWIYDGKTNTIHVIPEKYFVEALEEMSDDDALIPTPIIVFDKDDKGFDV